MIDLDVKDMTLQKVQEILVHAVSPRPIALVSTLSPDGIPNLTPFSFFNAFGSNPPTVAFSPARRGRDGTFKDTYNNLMASKECVINTVSYSMVDQVNLASCEYPSDVNEFSKSGLTPIASDLVKPQRVKESPFQMECKLVRMVNCGDGKASGNIAICEVLKFHVSDHVFVDGKIDPQLLDMAARNGGAYYTRASGSALFHVQKPGARLGMGFDKLPSFIINSNIYTGSNLGKLAIYEQIFSNSEVLEMIDSLENIEASESDFLSFERMKDYRKMLSASIYFHNQKSPKAASFIELSAKTAIECDDVDFGWKAALYKGMLYDDWNKS